MKKLRLKTPEYKDYERQFVQWLELIGMSKYACYYMPLHIRELFHYMESREIIRVEDITPGELRNYFGYLSLRKNQRRDGGLSKSHINKQLQAVKKFSEYVWRAKKILFTVPIKRQVTNDRRKPEVLTPEEIASLYDAAEVDRSLTLRDKMILDMCYGCGLRRTEARMLDLKDIDVGARRLYVRHGKNYTHRYVPFTKTMAHRIRTYLEHSRKEIMEDKDEQAFLVSLKRARINGVTMNVRLQNLQKISKVSSIREKKIGLHTLRHSIATHLLHRGLPLKQVSAFLGHKSVESTQIYTHLVHEL